METVTFTMSKEEAETLSTILADLFESVESDGRLEIQPYAQAWAKDLHTKLNAQIDLG